MRVWILVVVVLMFPFYSHAEPYKGVSCYACMYQSYPCGRFLGQYPNDISKPMLPVLYGYFGKNWKCVDSFLDKFRERDYLLEFHLSFRVQHRHYRRRLKAVQQWGNDKGVPKARIIISPVLEDNMPDKEWKRYARIIRRISGYRVVRSNIYGRLGGYYQEQHGAYPLFHRPNKRTIANLDGVSVNFGDGERYFNQISKKGASDFISRNRKRYGVALWSARQQGLNEAMQWGKYPHPTRRFKGLGPKEIITDRAIRGMRRLLRD